MLSQYEQFFLAVFKFLRRDSLNLGCFVICVFDNADPGFATLFPAKTVGGVANPAGGPAFGWVSGEIRYQDGLVTWYLNGTFGVHFRYNGSDVAVAASTGIDLPSGKILSVNGTQVVGARQTGTPGDATDLASALTLVNALKAKLTTHGLIA